MKMVVSALALLVIPSLLLGCGEEPPAGREPVIPIGSTPPPRPSGPVMTNPAGGNVPPVTSTPGTGGSGGSGGSGGVVPRSPDSRPADAPGSADAPLVAACSASVTAMGNDGLIDDFQDNNTAVRMVDGRMGSWKVKQSLTAMTNAMDGNPTVVQVGGQGNPPRALRLQGMEPDAMGQYGAEAEVVLVADESSGCYDASSYRGIQLSLKGLQGTSVFVMALTGSVRAQNTPDQVGGHYRFQVNFTNSNQFQTVMIPWDSFMPGWGTTPGPKVDPKLVYGISIVTAPRPSAGNGGTPSSIGSFDFTVDNVRFIAAP